MCVAQHKTSNAYSAQHSNTQRLQRTHSATHSAQYTAKRTA